MTNTRWAINELKQAFYLYCQLPFGRLHNGNPEIINFAAKLGRTPSAVAMKLVNFASLDPSITGTGRKGLSGASKLDRLVWDQFHDDWQSLVDECSELLGETEVPSQAISRAAEVSADYLGYTKEAQVQVRVRQGFFRKAVLASYGGKCCMSGVSEPRLLNASHIVPWSADPANRLNPANGLCLSALHDRAFDQGLIALTDELTILVSGRLKSSNDSFLNETLIKLEGSPIELPSRFLPAGEMIRWHRETLFLG